MSGYVFTVNGAPVAQGSHRAFVNPKTGRAIVTDAKKGLKPWRAAVADAAAEVRGDAPLLDGPVRLCARFIFPRPKAHFFTGKRAGVLRPDAPSYATSRQLGDLDKLVRGLGDALTGVLFRDDSQIASIESTKVYGVHSHCVVTVTPMKENR